MYIDGENAYYACVLGLFLGWVAYIKSPPKGMERDEYRLGDIDRYHVYRILHQYVLFLALENYF